VSGIGAEHQHAFDELVQRSRARTAGADRVAAASAALAAAALGAVESQGFTLADRSEGAEADEFTFDGEQGQTLVVRLGRPTGDDPAEVVASDVPFGVRFQSATSSVDPTVVTSPSGAVLVANDEWTGRAVSSVDLRLPLDRYLTPQLEVDAAAVQRDVAAAVVVVRGHLL
jgi:hypothetical protein